MRGTASEIVERTEGVFAMHNMMNERIFDLAVKTMSGQATAEERAELDSALGENPNLKDELDRLRANADVAKELLPVVAAMESTAGEFPSYARERLQTKVRETLRRPPVTERKLPWAWKLSLVL